MLSFADPVGSPSRIIGYNGKEKHITQLVNKVVAIDMNHWVLSEDKKSRWLITRMKILTSDLLLLELSDGNNSENMLFDWDSKAKVWNIIRRIPLNDWKPKNKRLGSRNTAILFPTIKMQNKSQ